MTDAPVLLPSIAVLGLGSMGGAILTGLLAPGVRVEGGVRVTNRDPPTPPPGTATRW